MGFYGLAYAAGVMSALYYLAMHWQIVRMYLRAELGDDEMIFPVAFIIAFFWPVFLPALTSNRNQ